jgi:hypothetical protein
MLNRVFTEAEMHLNMLKPLHPVWVSYGHQSCDGQPDQWELLGIDKHQCKWRLCHAYDHELNDDGPLYEFKPIVECPVDVRVRAAKVVRRLHERIVRSKEEYIPQVDEAIKEFTLSKDKVLLDRIRKNGIPWMGLQSALIGALPKIIEESERSRIAYANVPRAMDQLIGAGKWERDKRPCKSTGGKTTTTWLVLKPKA